MAHPILRDIEPRILGSMELARCILTYHAPGHPTHWASQTSQAEKSNKCTDAFHNPLTGQAGPD